MKQHFCDGLFGSRMVTGGSLGYGSEVECVLSMCEDQASNTYINKNMNEPTCLLLDSECVYCGSKRDSFMLKDL